MLWINLLPPLSSVIWGERFARPVDEGRLWADRRPILGSHKTWRGILASLLGGAVVFPVLHVPWWVAGGAALLAMSGDLLSSFIKRRLKYPSGAPIPVLDQLFEGLFPALFLAPHMSLSAAQLLGAVALFVPITYLGSLFWHYVIYRPPAANYPRIIRSSVRLREWRACHVPLARWHKWLNFESYVYYRVLLARFFTLVGMYDQGLRNTLNVRLEEQTFWLPALPAQFDGFRILLMTDLHLDGLDGLTDVVIERIRPLRVDLCLIGGDVRMEMYGPMAPALRQLRRLLSQVQSRYGVLGVLGNHDCIEMVPEFEQAGVMMLINDSQPLDRDGERIWVIGVDDPHYYKTHDVPLACRQVPADAFRILVAHSPEAYCEAAAACCHLYLCGHTHGGQIRLPWGGPLFTHSRAPRRTAAGRWEYRGMIGYTSCGVGASGIPLRFNCPGEISLLTLRSGYGRALSADSL